MRFHWFLSSRGPRTIARKALKALGHSWHASPIRRLIQAGCFGLFLVLFFYVSRAGPGSGAAGEDFAQARSSKEFVHIYLFLAIDPLVSISTAIAARTWVWSLSFAGVILAVSLVLPRFFCGYVCPMGTLIDLFDFGLTNRVRATRAGGALRTRRPGWWRNLRYYLLAAVLAAAVGGVVLSGFVAAIPVVTRGFQFIISPLQTWHAHGRPSVGFGGDWGKVPPMNAGHFISIGLFALVLLLGFLRPRFWCRHLCPSGAIFSIVNLFRLTERKVGSDCIQCGRCSRICSFDAINDDFSTLAANCTFCQTCGGVCPVGAIEFSPRVGGNPTRLAATRSREAAEGSVPEGHGRFDSSRRGFVLGLAAGAVGGGLAAAGVRLPAAGAAGAGDGATGAGDGRAAPAHRLVALVRPPGSVPEDQFLRLCVRCGQCLRVCPSNVLQPADLAKGFNRLWTPWANTDWAGCEPTCNNCGQVCPTGAIRALAMEQKKGIHMGLAKVDDRTCLHCNGKNECLTRADQGDSQHLICSDACPYDIIDASEGYPVLMKDKAQNDLCIGCGMCQAACFAANVRTKKLSAAAIYVEAGGSREDRTPAGAPIRLRSSQSQGRTPDQGNHGESGEGAEPGQPGHAPAASQPTTKVDVPYDSGD